MPNCSGEQIFLMRVSGCMESPGELSYSGKSEKAFLEKVLPQGRTKEWGKDKEKCTEEKWERKSKKKEKVVLNLFKICTIPSFNKYLLRTYFILCILIGPRDIPMNRQFILYEGSYYYQDSKITTITFLKINDKSTKIIFNNL